MSGKTTIVIIALAAALAQPKAGKPDGSITLPTPAANVARRFLFAFSENDRETIGALLPSKIENLYGPSPFGEKPKLFKPRVDKRVAAVDFEGRMTDGSLPSRGTIVLRLVEENGVRAWRLRQIYWYEDLPPEAEIPDESRSVDDRRQEPIVIDRAATFVDAWLQGDYETMDDMTFHWWDVPRDPPKWIKMTAADLSGRRTDLDGLRVNFVAHLRVARFLPKQVQGNLWLVKEDGVWRVRPLTFTFAF